MERVRKTLFAAAAILFPFTAFAGQSERFHVPAEGFNSIVNETIGSFRPQDVFASLSDCTIVDVMNIRPYTLPEAVSLLAPCMKSLTARYGVALAAKAGVITPTVLGRDTDNGIMIEIKGDISAESPILRDLKHSLYKRNNSLLGFPAKLSRETVFRTQNDDGETAGRSAVQDSLDRCILPTIVRPVRSGEDFVKYFGGCILRDKTLKVREIRPAPGHKLAVALHCDSENRGVEALNGYVRVHGEQGEVDVLIIAYPLTIDLP